MTIETILKNAQAIVDEKNSYENGYHYELVTNDWENYGKNRTYVSIVETRDNSKHYAKQAYGYYDNVANEYISGINGNNLEF